MDPSDPPCNRSDSGSPLLMTTNATIISNEQCTKAKAIVRWCNPATNTVEKGAYYYEKEVFDDMICIESSGRGICKGDSGGPTTTEVDGKHILVGASSWSKGCGKVSIYCF